MVYDTSVRALFLWDQFHYGSLHIINIETVRVGEQRPCSGTQSVISLVGIGNAMQTVTEGDGIIYTQHNERPRLTLSVDVTMYQGPRIIMSMGSNG